MSLTAPLAQLLGRFTTLEGATALVAARLVAVVVTLAALLVVYRLLVRLIDRVLRERGHEARTLPARTLAPFLINITRWVLAFIGVVIALREVGVDVQAVLVSAGVLGLAVGLGAQSLIKDVITGFFNLFEGLIAVGDTIEVGAYRGTVEAIGLRVTKLRMADGALRIVPNGNLTEFANHSRG